MTQISLLSGIRSDAQADLQTSYPINLIPVPKDTGVSKGYLRCAPGLTQFATGVGIDRGGINWNGVCYRLSGESLVKVNADGTVTTVSAAITGSDQGSLDYGATYLSVVSGGKAWLYDGTTLTQITDVDLGTVIDHVWVDGYYLFTDGQYLIATELNNPFSIDPLKYGSSESDPDPVKGLLRHNGEVYAFNRYTIEAFQNIGGTGFPFQRIETAMMEKGAVGTHAKSHFGETFAWLGSGRNEPCSVYVMSGSQPSKIATREVERRLKAYTEDQLATAVVEQRADEAHQHLLVHLPGETMVYDFAASLVAQEPIWFFLSSAVAGVSTYRARNFVWCYGKWICGDTSDGRIGYVDDTTCDQYATEPGFQFDTMMLYAGGKQATVWSLELVGTTGRAALGESPTIFHSYTTDGLNWSQERQVSMGQSGQTNIRVQWRRCGRIENMRGERFRWVGGTPVSWMRLEAEIA